VRDEFVGVPDSESAAHLSVCSDFSLADGGWRGEASRLEGSQST